MILNLIAAEFAESYCVLLQKTFGTDVRQHCFIAEELVSESNSRHLPMFESNAQLVLMFSMLYGA